MPTARKTSYSMSQGRGLGSIKMPRRAVSVRKEHRDRVCMLLDCDTRLTSYNTEKYCFIHVPKKAFRVRGRK